MPTSIQDALIYGSRIYWMAGFVPQASSYFMFILLILLVAFTTGVMFSIFSAIIKDRQVLLIGFRVFVARGT
jgi:hypothetical protein